MTPRDRQIPRNIRFHRTRTSLLTLALGSAIGLLSMQTANAQSTTASVYGTAPAGTTVTIQSDTGLTRTVPVDASGRYSAGSLPIGTYSIVLQRDGQPVETRRGIVLRVNSGTDVSFGASAAGATTLDTVNVTASNVPSVDVTTVDSRTVITADELQRLPLARSAEAIALLAPGTVQGSGYFDEGPYRGALSFGGAGVTENAYYVNGFATGNPLSNIGGITLPYGSIAQQETYTGGYSARYGRSAGGVISQVGKRGTNEWKFGGQVVWAPRPLASEPRNIFYPGANAPDGYDYEDPSLPGTLYRSRKDDTSWNTVYSAYAGGPLIPDRLFLFVSAEQEKSQGVSTNSVESAVIGRNHYQISEPKLYGKIDWNINDSNILELTGIKSNYREGGYYNAFDYDSLSEGGRNDAFPDTIKNNNTYYVGKYTSYLTDALTFSATYGKSEQDDYRNNPATLPYISGANLQDPSIVGDNPVRNNQTSTQSRDGSNKTRGLRLDLEWVLGDHTLSGGVDNMYYDSSNEGVYTTGPGYYWIYSRSGSPDSPINSALGVGAPGGDGYYVGKRVFVTATDMSVKQKAYFLEDRWQVTDTLLLSLGLRNDKFTNYNSANKAYVDSGDQWAPRLGASWDVFGDSSLKIYANAGRYYLALPNSVAIRGASASTYTTEYFTYTGIDEDGNPVVDRALGPGPVSSNNEYGQTPDARTFAARNLKSMYQDEFILGFDKTLGSSWATGAKFTYRNLGATIDDICDGARMVDKLEASGIDPDSVDVPGCVVFNPGETNTFDLANLDGSGYTRLSMSKSDWGFDKSAKRKYLAMDLYLHHPFDGKWEGRIDYTLSHNFGNTEGQVKSDIGQTDVSKTQDWDAAPIMWYSGGDLANDRRHQIKIYGAYQIAPEWLASANIRIMSGTPKSCLGYNSLDGTDEGSTEGDPIGYGASYHICNGEPSRPGDAGRTPWTKLVDLGVAYRPQFADGKLAFGLQVFNVFDERKAVQVDSNWETDAYTLSNTYNMGLYYTQPRYAQLSVSYDY